MLEKIPGRPPLHKLRLIRLLEADLNISLGILWGHRLVIRGERLMAFGGRAMGISSRPQCDCSRIS
jgi:hypothetical protein